MISIRSVVVICLFLLCLLINSCVSVRILSVVTSVSSWIPTTGPVDGIGKPKPTGYWMVEFTHSYTVFTSAGYIVDVASPTGYGAVDPTGFAFYANDPMSTALWAKDINGQQYVPLTNITHKLSDIDPTKYDAVFFVGGTGAMFDYINNTDIQRIVRWMWENNRIVSGVCHGPLAFTQVQLTNGKWFLQNRRVTGFSTDEEQVLGKSNVCALCPYTPGCNVTTCDGPYMPTEYPRHGSYLLEEGLKAKGAIYSATAQDWDTYHYSPHVVVDGRLITGQNPGAGLETAKAVVAALNFQSRCPIEVNNVYTEIQCTPIALYPGDPQSVCTTSPDPILVPQANLKCYNITNNSSDTINGGNKNKANIATNNLVTTAIVASLTFFTLIML